MYKSVPAISLPDTTTLDLAKPKSEIFKINSPFSSWIRTLKEKNER
jgi:hypothetical protein